MRRKPARGLDGTNSPVAAVHIRKTYWALGFISTVRIGAGAWRNPAITQESGDTDQAKTNLHDAEGNGNRKKNEQTLLKRKPKTKPGKKRRAFVRIESPPLSRAPELHSVRLRAATSIELKERKPAGYSTTL